jgi:hypothetical protein
MILPSSILTPFSFRLLMVRGSLIRLWRARAKEASSLPLESAVILNSLIIPPI